MDNGTYMKPLNDLMIYNIRWRDSRIASLERELDETKKRLIRVLKVSFNGFRSLKLIQIFLKECDELKRACNLNLT